MSSIVYNDCNDFVSLCRQAFQEEEIFKNFKNSPVYRKILEHANKIQGQEHYDIALRQYPELENYFHKFKKNDSIGSPIVEDYDFGVFSPTTLQYIKVLSDLLKEFGEKKLSNINILEIGVGYGGQSCIIRDYLDVNNYTFVDLPEPIALTKKYVESYGYLNNKFINHSDDIVEILKKDSYDLVVSNYAFSELYKPLQKEYISLFENINMGYLTCNQISSQCFSKSEMLENILFDVKTSADIRSENRNNYILTW